MTAVGSAGNSETTIRICIIEDHAIVRAALRMLIESQPGMEVTLETGTATQALSAKNYANPDIVLLDLDLGQENGIEFLPELLRKFSPARVLVLTAATATEIHLAVVQAGASGVVIKEEAPGTLVSAIRRLHSGEVWLGSSLMKAVVDKVSQSSRTRKPKDPEAEKIALLTPRELEIVGLVSEGLNSNRIAKQLRISEATVRNHLTSVLGKLELTNKFELAVYAYRRGLSPAKS